MVTFCILSNNCEMKSMVNAETFMLAKLEHLNACNISGYAKSDFFVTSTKLLSCSLPQSARIEPSVSAGGLIQQTIARRWLCGS